MIKKLLLLTFLSFTTSFQAQVIYETINSSKLGTERELKIQLPRNYENNPEKRYPVIIVLDGDYLFEPMAGNVDLYSYWEEMPEAIVVGVNQSNSRRDDSFYADQTFLPFETGAAFFEFLGIELLPHLGQKYRTAKYEVLAGHDHTANFINYYMFKPDPIFDAYINLSPELAPEMSNRLVEAFRTATSHKWFYLATSSGDVKVLRNDAEILNEQLQGIENEYFHYKFDNFDGASHFGLIGEALPRALQHIFSTFSPISMREYESQIATLQTSPYDYLIEKYERIEQLYGLNMTIRVNDFLAIGKALEERQNWDDLEKLGELARKHYPKGTLGIYYQARAYEAYGRTRKAMKTYQSAYGMEEISFVTIDFMLDKAEKIKNDFGY